MHQIRFLLGSAPDPAGGAQRSPSPLAVFKGPTSKERKGEGKGSRRRREEREGERRGEGICRTNVKLLSTRL